METTIDHIPRPSVTETLGHIAPGGALLGGIYLFELWVRHALHGRSAELHLPLTTALGFVGEGFKGENWLLPLLVALGLLLATYITGHIVDSISALCLDRTLIYRGYGYPYQHLFNYLPREIVPEIPSGPPADALAKPVADAPADEVESVPATVVGTVGVPQTAASDPLAPIAAQEVADGEALETGGAEKVNVAKLFEPRLTRPMHPRWMLFTRSYYRVIFLWLNVYLLLRWLALADSAWGYLYWPTILKWIGTAMIIGVTVMLLASFFINNRWLRGKVENYSKGSASLTSRVAWLMIRAPYEIAVKPLSTTLDTRRSFDSVFIRKYEAMFRELFGMDANTAESNNFWLSMLYVREQSTRLTRILQHWQTLYEFSRNLSTAFYLAGIYTLSWVGYNWSLIGTTAANGNRIILWCPLVFLALAVMMLIHFYYHYVCYHSKFLYRAFVFLAEQEVRTGRSAAARRRSRYRALAVEGELAAVS